jgi:hypothetical protein
MPYYGAVQDLKRPTESSLLVRFVVPSGFASGTWTVLDTWTGVAATGVSIESASDMSIDPANPTARIIGLLPTRRYTIGASVTLSDASVGAATPVFLDTLLNSTDLSDANWWWIGERTPVVRRTADSSLRRISLNTNTAGRHCAFGMSCQSQNTRVRICSVRMLFRDRDRGLEARTV